MDLTEIIRKRHSVRSYSEKPIPEDVVAALQKEIKACNAESGLHIHLITNEPRAFDSFLAHYGKFSGVRNYIALVGKRDRSLQENIGYYGERLALKAQELGLNTCWVAMTFSKRKCEAVVAADEKLMCVLALGYGNTQGVPHKSKEMSALCKTEGEPPAWFRNGMECAMLAPTAMNQQKFVIALNKDGTVSLIDKGGVYSKIDAGIVKYHFECGANGNCRWKK